MHETLDISKEYSEKLSIKNLRNSLYNLQCSHIVSDLNKLFVRQCIYCQRPKFFVSNLTNIVIAMKYLLSKIFLAVCMGLGTCSGL